MKTKRIFTKPIITSLFLVGVITISSTFAIVANTVDTWTVDTWAVEVQPVAVSLSQNLLNKKTILESTLANTYNIIYSKYQSEIYPLLQTPNYNSLKCMNLLSNHDIIWDIDEEIETIRKNILEKYVELNAKTFNLINQYSVWLITDVVYSTEKQTIELEIESYMTVNKALLEEFITEYSQEIIEVKEEISNFSKQNNELLKSLNNKIISIQEIFKQETILQEWIFQINNAMDIRNNNFFEEIENMKTLSIEMLKNKLDNISNTYISTYLNNSSSKDVLSKKKKHILDMFTYELDNEIDWLFGNRYDRKTYEDIEHQTKVLKDLFYENGNIACNNVLKTKIDLDGYIKTVSEEVQTMILHIDNWLKVIWQTWASQDFKNNILLSFKSFYTKHIEQDEQEFRSFARDHASKYSTEYKQIQSSKLSQIQHKWQNISFNEAYQKGQKNENIKVLQEILKRQKLYNWEITSTYTQETIDAVYQLQLQWNLLVWYEDRPEVFWHFGPATREYAYKKLQEEINKDKLNILKENEEDLSQKEKEKTKGQKDKLVEAIYNLEKKFSSREQFRLWINMVSEKLEKKIQNNKISLNKRFVFQKIQTAILTYLNETQ